MRGESENDESESTTSRRRSISESTWVRRRATPRIVRILDDELDRHAQPIQRVLELVRDGGRGLAHRGEALGLDQRLLGRLELDAFARATRCSSELAASRRSRSRCCDGLLHFEKVAAPALRARRLRPAGSTSCGRAVLTGRDAGGARALSTSSGRVR